MGNGDDASLHGLMLQLLKRQDALEDAIREQREMLKTISMSQGQHLLATSLMMAFDNNSATITSNQSAEPRPTVTLGEVMSEPGPLQGKQTATLQQFPSFQFMAGKARGSVSDSGSAKPLPQVNSNRSASGPSEGEEKIIRVERLSDTGVSTVSSSPQLDLGVPSRIFIEHSDRNSPSTKHTSDPDSSKLSIMSYETTGAGAKLVGLDALVEHARIHRSIRIMQSHNSDLYSGPENSSEPFDGQRSPKSGRTPGASDARLQRIDDNEDSQSPQGRDANPFALPPHGIADPASAGTVSLLLVAEDPSPPPPPAQPTYTSSSSMGHDGYPPRLPSSMSEPYALSPGPFLTTKVSTTSFFSQNSLVATPSLIRQASLNRQRKVVHPAMSILHQVFWEIWDPSNILHIHWDMIMLFLMIYIVIFTPYFIAFDISTSSLDNPAAITDLIVNCFFMLDVLLMFRCSYPNPDPNSKEKLIKDRWMIAQNYLLGWFWVDIISSLPWSQILAPVSTSNAQSVAMVLRVTRLVRLLRLFQLTKVIRVLTRSNIKNFVSQMEAAVGRTMMRMLQLLMLAFTLIHWSACVFYFTANVQGTSAQTWLMEYQLFILDDNGQVGYSAPNIVRYICSLYWAVVTMTTLGYGDITPVTTAEKVVAIFIILIGATLFAYFMASIASILHASDSTASRLVKRKVDVEDFLKHRQIPEPLSSKVSDFCNYTLDRKVVKEENEILAGLSMSLRTQVIMHLYKEVVEKVPLFKDKPPHFITSLVTCLKLEYYAKGDIVIRQWEMGREMFFIGEAGEEEEDRGQVEQGLSFRVYSRDFGNTSVVKMESKPSLTAPSAKSSNMFSRTSLNVPKLVRDSLSPFKFKPPSKPPAARSQMTYLVEDDLKAAELDYKEVDRLYTGGSFGINSCILGEPRAATVIARCFCELHSLRRSDLDEVLKQWPELADDLGGMLRDPSYHCIEDKAWLLREEMKLPGRPVSPGEVAFDSRPSRETPTLIATSSRLAPRPGERASAPACDLPHVSSLGRSLAKKVVDSPFIRIHSQGHASEGGGAAVPLSRLSATHQQHEQASGMPHFKRMLEQTTSEKLKGNPFVDTPLLSYTRPPPSSSKIHIQWAKDISAKGASQSANANPKVDPAPPAASSSSSLTPKCEPCFDSNPIEGRPPSLMDGMPSVPLPQRIARNSAVLDVICSDSFGRGMSLKAWESKGLVSELKAEDMRRDSKGSSGRGEQIHGKLEENDAEGSS